jgi:hypothetical protein
MSGYFILRWAVTATLLGVAVSAVLGPPTRIAHIHLVRALKPVVSGLRSGETGLSSFETFATRDGVADTIHR